MSIAYATIVDAIAKINRGVSGIRESFTSQDLPTQISTVPAAVTLVGMDDWGKFGLTDYVVRVYVAPVINGNPADAYRDCLSLMQNFRDAYAALASVGGLPLMRQPHSAHGGFGASGFMYTMHWGGTEYFGFEFHLPLGPNI